MAKCEPVRLREPKTDCINYSCGGLYIHGGCTGLNELYCATELKECPFYKSNKDYYPDGSPRKE